jgi:hypothetical protein
MNPPYKSERIAQVFVGVLGLGGLLFLVLWFPIVDKHLVRTFYNRDARHFNC